MKLSRIDQLSIGLWLALAVGIGILSRSWEAAAAPLLAGTFFLAPTFAWRGIGVTNAPLRIVSWLVVIGWVIAFLMMFFGTVERLYYVNGDSYPRWLATGELQKPANGANVIDELRNGPCKDAGIEITGKRDGVYVIRCGFSWYDSKTYLANFDPMPTLSKKAGHDE